MEQQKQKRILHAATELFGLHGFHRVAIDEIAKKAGVSKGTVYNFAESKDDLYFKVVEDELSAWVAECESRVDPKKPADALLIEAAMNNFNYLDSKPTLRQLLVEDIERSMTMWVDRMKHIRQRCAANAAHILQIGMEQGRFRRDLNVQDTATVLNDLVIHGLVMKYRVGPAEALRWSTAALDLVLRGLRA